MPMEALKADLKLIKTRMLAGKAGLRWRTRCVQLADQSMSDSYITLVPDLMNKSQSEYLAHRVTDYLKERQIIQSFKTDCTLGETGFAPGKNYQSVLIGKHHDIQSLSVNGLEVITLRSVFHNGGGGLDSISCPVCGLNVIDTRWSEAIVEWFNDTGKEELECIHCKSIKLITNYIFTPTWGFGVLGFKFWNWPQLNMAFLNSIEQLTGSQIKIIHGRI